MNASELNSEGDGDSLKGFKQDNDIFSIYILERPF